MRGDRRARELQHELWSLITRGHATHEQRRLYGFVTQHIDWYASLPLIRVDGNIMWIERKLTGFGWLARSL